MHVSSSFVRIHYVGLNILIKLKLQYFGHLRWRVDSLEKTLMLGEIGGRRRRGQRMRWLDDITNSMDVSWTWVWVNSGNWWWTGRPGVLWFMGSQRFGHDWATELNWMLTLVICLFPLFLIDIFTSHTEMLMSPTLIDAHICTHLCVCVCVCISHSVVSDSLWPHKL